MSIIKLYSSWLSVFGGLSLGYFTSVSPALGQVSPDGTLPTQVIPQPGNVWRITGGKQVGGNLFHSFAEFSVPADSTAYFSNTANINNIISRVTGGEVSNIEGIIKADGMANLFLINPNGIIFGPHAQINIGGSFLASTANSLQFADGREFSATNPQEAALLTMSVPIGLQFGNNPGSIVTQGSSLQVNPGETLALMGGNLAIQGGKLEASGGRIELGSVGSNSLVRLTAINPGWQAGYEGVKNFQDINISQGAVVDGSGGGGGIQIQGRHISVMDGSQITLVATGDKSAGNLTINASESVQLIGISSQNQQGSGLLVQVEENATGRGGNLLINTKQLILRDGGGVSAGTFGDGQGGTLEVNASEFVEIIGTGFSNPSLLTTSATGAGDGGQLVVNTGRLSIQDGGQILAVTVGSGKGGTITINASQLVEVVGRGIVSQQGKTQAISSSISAASGFKDLNLSGIAEGGNLSIKTGQLIVKDGAEITVSSFGSGNAGNLHITADSISLDEQGKLTAETSSGEGGNINLNVADLLLLRHNSLISTTAGAEGGGGNGGNININTRFLVAPASENSDIIANAFTGNGGNINITATGIFGIAFRDQLTPLSDISASSTFGASGTVSVSRPEVDPQSSLLKLPSEVVDAKNLIVQGCSTGGSLTKGEFIITGRGGLPPDPLNALETNNGLVDLGYPNLNSDPQSSQKLFDTLTQSNLESQPQPSLSPQPILEAQGWIQDDNGKVVLTANASTVTPHSSGLTPATCYDFRASSASPSLPTAAIPDGNPPTR